MSQAFGPYYSRGPIEEPQDCNTPYNLQDAVLAVVLVLGFITVMMVL